MADTGFLNLQFVDYDGEVATLRVHTAALTAGNFAAQDTARTFFIAAVNLMSLSVKTKRVFGNETLLSADRPTDPKSQRELKWLVSYRDNTSQARYSFEIPCANVDQLDPNDRRHANLGGGGPPDLLKTYAEAYLKSPTGGSITVDEITLVGRAI